MEITFSVQRYLELRADGFTAMAAIYWARRARDSYLMNPRRSY
jgi:hypothetical protein